MMTWIIGVPTWIVAPTPTFTLLATRIWSLVCVGPFCEPDRVYDTMPVNHDFEIAAPHSQPGGGELPAWIGLPGPPTGSRSEIGMYPASQPAMRKSGSTSE